MFIDHRPNPAQGFEKAIFPSGMHYFGRLQPFQFGLQRDGGIHFGGPKIARGQVDHRQPEHLSLPTQGGEVIVAFGREYLFIEVCARAEDLGYLAIDQFARHSLLGLLTHGYLTTGLQQLADVVVRRMKWNAAHRCAATFS